MVELKKHFRGVYGSDNWSPVMWDENERQMDDVPVPGQVVLGITFSYGQYISNARSTKDMRGLVVASDGIKTCWVLWSF